MPDGVVFDENQGFDAIPLPRTEPPTLGKVIVRMGIVNSPADASVILAVLASLLIAVSFYLLASSVPTPPTLGDDVFRQGERTPSYVR